MVAVENDAPCCHLGIQTDNGSAILVYYPSLREGKERRGIPVGGYKPGLEGAPITSAHTLLSRTQSHNHINLQGS